MSKNEENKNTEINSDENIKDQVEEILEDAIERAESVSSEEDEQGQQKGNGEMEQLKADLEKEKEKFLRLFAEFENYKKRTGKERLEMFKTAGQEVMQALLPVLDDFDRAQNEIKKAKDKNLMKGVELIHNKLKETLRSKGLEIMEIKAGDNFDADIHEAITQIDAPTKELKGKIVDVVENGYKLGDRIIRYPKVVTGK